MARDYALHRPHLRAAGDGLAAGVLLWLRQREVVHAGELQVGRDQFAQPRLALVVELEGDRPRQQREVERHRDGAAGRRRRLEWEEVDHALQDRGGPPVGVGLAVAGVRARHELVRLLGEHPLVGVEEHDGADVLLLHALTPQRQHDPPEELEGEGDEVLDPEVARGELLDELGVPPAPGEAARRGGGEEARLVALAPLLVAVGVEDLHARHERQRLDAAADDEELLGDGEQRLASLQDDEGVVPALQHHLVDVQVAARAEAGHVEELRRAPHRRHVERVERHRVAVAVQPDHLERLAAAGEARRQLDDLAVAVAAPENRLPQVPAPGHQRILQRQDHTHSSPSSSSSSQPRIPN